MAVEHAVWCPGRGCSSWALLLLAMGEVFEWRCAGFVHLVSVALDNREIVVLYVVFVSEDVTLCIVRSCVALGNTTV